MKDLVLLCAVMTAMAWSQAPAAAPAAMTDADVVAMTRAGFAPGIILAKMASAPTAFDTSTAALTQMKAAGVPDQVLLSLLGGPESREGRSHVFVVPSTSWEITAGWLRNGGGAGGGARPQTAEIIKTFDQRCPNVTVTNNAAEASYTVMVEHEDGKSVLARKNKVAVFNRRGDNIYGGSTRMLGTGVQNACAAIARDQGQPDPVVYPQNLLELIGFWMRQ